MQIMRCLHFTDPYQQVPQKEEANYDGTYKERYIMEILNKQMKDQQGTIDECVVSYKEGLHSSNTCLLNQQNGASNFGY